MILARRIFIVGIGYLEGAQEVPDLSLAVALTGNGLEWAGGPKRTQKPHQNYFSPNHIWAPTFGASTIS